MNTFEDIEEGLRLTLNELPIVRRTIMEKQTLREWIGSKIDPSKKYNREDREKLLIDARNAGYESTDGTIYFYINAAQKAAGHPPSTAPGGGQAWQESESGADKRKQVA